MYQKLLAEVLKTVIGLKRQLNIFFGAFNPNKYLKITMPVRCK